MKVAAVHTGCVVVTSTLSNSKSGLIPAPLFRTREPTAVFDQAAEIFDLTCVARVAVDDAARRTLSVGSGEYCGSLRIVQVGIGHGRQVIFGLREYGFMVVEQQILVGDVKRVNLLPGVSMTGTVISRIRRHMEALVPAFGDQ